MNKFILIFILTLIHLVGFSQKGKNGAGNISISTVVNAYTSLSADAFTGNTTINVASGAGYAIGDLIYIIQMQGASTNCFINPFGNPNSAEPYTPAFGKITNYNNAGNNEYAQVSSVAGNVITIDCPLKNNYTAAGKVQVIKVPRYTSLTITATGIITCPAWNGTTGGVIAIEVDGNTTINAGGKIDASALGFRGGIVIGKLVSSVFGGGSYANNNVNEGGYKGEGIAGSVADYLANFNGPYCKGAVANAGGGGNGNNAGGGGGANAGDTSLYLGTGNPDISIAGYVTAWNLEVAGFAGTTSSGGGRGGYSFSSINLNPRTSAPGLAGWSGDNRRVAGGLGGRPLNYNTGRLFSGGGGGAADENDAYGGAGGNGGGIINIISYGTVTGAGQILANGQNGFNTLTPTPGFFVTGRDGAGGAGGGGAIVINSIGLINALTVSANGGNGGNQQMKNGAGITAGAYGPGGGGGGGYIGTTAAAITAAVNGGVNGTVQYLSGLENCQIDIVPATNSFPANGATIGGSGIITSTLQTVPAITASPDVTICINNSTILTATTTGPPSTISWYTNFAGTTLLGTGSAFTTSVFTSPVTYTIWAGFCPSGIYRDPVVITVTNGPTLTTTSQTLCAGQTATLVASGATTYTWNTGSNSSTINPTPAATTVYTVIGASGTCSAQTTATVTVNSGGAITVNSATICSGQTATLVASGATTYTWNTGSNSSTINPTPIATTIYTVNGSIGAGCNLTNTATVSVISTPTLSVTSASICSGQTATLVASGATTYTWNTGSNSATINPTPVTTTTFSVVGANGTCSASATVSVTVGSIALTATSQTLCAGQTATLVASGATTYTWNTGSNSATINPAPAATTIYTVIGASGTCSASTTATVSVISTPALSVTSASICSGQTATLVASGATTYTWNTGSNSATINPTPVATTVYTVTGSNGTCSTSAIASVTVGSITLTATSQTICAGLTATIVASGATTYSWNTGSISATINPTPAATTVYTVIGANGTCSASTTATVTINASGAIAVNSTTICSGQTATLSAGAASSYTWNTGQNTQNIVVNPLTTTIYTINATLGAGCNASNTATVTVNTNPTVTVNNASICVGQTATLNAVGAISYVWYDGSIAASNTVSPITTTSYSVVGSSNGCTNSATANVVVTPNPTVSATSVSICAGQTASLTGLGATTYTWDPSGANTVGATFTASPAGTTVYNLLGSTNGCASSATVSVSVGSNLSVSANNATICSGQSASLNASSTATNYSWSTGATTNSIIVNPIVNTTYTVNGNSAGCTGSTTATVFVTTTPVIPNYNQAICVGETTTLTAVGATSYVWNTGSTATVIIVNPTITTSYTLIGANGSCTMSANYNITVNSLPTISTNSATICNGASTTLTANGATSYTWIPLGTISNTISVNPASNTNYTVIGSIGSCTNIATASVVVTNGGTVAVTGATVCNGQNATIGTSAVGSAYLWDNGATTQSITVAPNTTTSYSVQVTLGGCVLTGSTTVGITSAPTINAIGASICAGQTATLSASGATNYTWMPGNLTGNNITVNPNTTTNYIVSSYNNGCTSTATTQVQVNTKPSLTLTPSTPIVCPNTPITFIATGATSYDWFVDGNYQFGNPLIIAPSKTSVISVIGSNGGCTASLVTTAYVSTLNAAFNAESNYVDYPGSLSFTNTSTGYNTIYWDFGNGQTSATNNNIALYEYPGKYLVTLLAHDTLGCTDTTFYVIEAGCGNGDFFIPNTFTPNQDGLNDTFKIFGGTCLTKFSGAIFDRWGHEVFKFKNITDVWDGKVKGIDIEIGTYNYLINYTLYNGKQFSKTGVITVER